MIKMNYIYYNKLLNIGEFNFNLYSEK